MSFMCGHTRYVSHSYVVRAPIELPSNRLSNQRPAGDNGNPVREHSNAGDIHAYLFREMLGHRHSIGRVTGSKGAKQVELKQSAQPRASREGIAVALGDAKDPARRACRKTLLNEREIHLAMNQVAAGLCDNLPKTR